jgi:hypothetical protein
MIGNATALWAAVVWLAVRLSPRYQMVAEFYLVVFEYVVKVLFSFIEMDFEAFCEALDARLSSATLGSQ